MRRGNAARPAPPARAVAFGRKGWDDVSRLKGLPQRLAPAPRAVGFADRKEAQRARDRARVQGDNLRRLYRTKRWRDLRLEIYARAGGMCQGCDRPHQLNQIKHHPDSLVVDHIQPHRGNLALFWDEANLQAVCKAWHDSEKQRREKAAQRTAPGEGWG